MPKALAVYDRCGLSSGGAAVLINATGANVGGGQAALPLLGSAVSVSLVLNHAVLAQSELRAGSC